MMRYFNILPFYLALVAFALAVFAVLIVALFNIVNIVLLDIALF